MIYCCIITIHSYHKLLESTVSILASSAAIAIISRPQQSPPVSYNFVSNICQVRFKNYFQEIWMKNGHLLRK